MPTKGLPVNTFLIFVLPIPGGAANCGAAIAAAAADGIISITYNTPVVGLAAGSNQIQLRPYLRTGANPVPTLAAELTAGRNEGAVDWACVSATAATASARFGAVIVGLGVAGVVDGFVPAECR